MRVIAAIRVLIKSVRDALIQRVDFLGRVGETFTGREMFGHYGFCSWPLPGSEGVGLKISGDNNNVIIIATEDRRFRIELKEGESALYTDEGDYVRLERGNVLHVYSKKRIHAESVEEIVAEAGTEITATAGTKITAKAPDILAEATISILAKAPDITSEASVKATVKAPLIDLFGNVTAHDYAGGAAGEYNLYGTVTVHGNIIATGDVNADGEVSDGVRKMSEDRAIYNGHTHGYLDAGYGHRDASDPPTQQE
jgi:phage baseplate assembly protein V